MAWFDAISAASTTVAPVAKLGQYKKKRLPGEDGTDGDFGGCKIFIIICTSDSERATAFNRDTLGLSAACEDSFAGAFNMGGVDLRISIVADFTPHEHNILGFSVPDVAATVKALREKGITFNIYQGFSQDESAS